MERLTLTRFFCFSPRSHLPLTLRCHVSCIGISCLFVRYILCILLWDAGKSLDFFRPLFEVTLDPSTHPKLHIFLQQLVGIDSVDDESKHDADMFEKMKTPDLWCTDAEPPYSYYAYYFAANIFVLNKLRKSRGLSTSDCFSFDTIIFDLTLF